MKRKKIKNNCHVLKSYFLNADQPGSVSTKKSGLQYYALLVGLLGSTTLSVIITII